MGRRAGWAAAVLAAALGCGGESRPVPGATEAELAALRAQLAAQRSARERLAGEVARLEFELAALRALGGAGDGLRAGFGAGAAAPDGPGDDVPPAAVDAEVEAAAAADAADAWFDAAKLGASGLPERDAADLRRIFEETELQRLYLRDQATREGWPRGRLAAELAALDERMASVRDGYGDAAYDWLLYAAGRSNRVKVESVLAGSAAAEAGLRPGDYVVGYAGERIFKPHALVRSTRSGRLGETVDLEVQRGSERVRVSVPRGPLGVRIGRDTVEPTPVR